MAVGARNPRGVLLSPIINEADDRGRRRPIRGTDVDVANDHDDDDDGAGTEGGGYAPCRKTRTLVHFHYAAVFLFLASSFGMHRIDTNPRRRRPTSSSDAYRLATTRRGGTTNAPGGGHDDASTSSRRRRGKYRRRHSSNARLVDGGASDAPLFYHVSPGSTGSRTLYHAA